MSEEIQQRMAWMASIALNGNECVLVYAWDPKKKILDMMLGITNHHERDVNESSMNNASIEYVKCRSCAREGTVKP